MKIYDSQKKGLVEFKSIEDGKVSMYVCGPTVYDLPHLGHGRSAVCFDVIRRYFEHKGLDVNFVSNYTDIDDKMIKRANEEGISVKQLADKIIPEYLKDYGDLGVKVSSASPKATEYIEQMVELIKTLEIQGHAYRISDGMYFDVSTYPSYGKFSGQDLDALEMGSRVEVKEEKRNPQDFALWKFAKDEEAYNDYWPSPWGDGRPGWHIECSAMSRAILGDKFDIHGGGLDLKFPHHECEVAQSKCALGENSFAQYWMHNGFIQIDNEKMSKSLGNFFTLRDIFKKYDPVVVRFMFLQTRYSNPINFSDELLENAKSGLKSIHKFVAGLRDGYEDLPSDIDGLDTAKLAIDIELLRHGFEDSMDEDFNTSGAFGVLSDLIRQVNGLRSAGRLSKVDVDEAEKFLRSIDSVLGVIFHEVAAEYVKIPDKVVELAEKREDARKNRDFATSDKLRDEIKEAGYLVEDTSDGFVLKSI